jgi:DNA-binding transcriptional regulator LsrR (DeoR family)
MRAKKSTKVPHDKYLDFVYDIANRVLIEEIPKDVVAKEMGVSKTVVYRALNYAFKNKLVTYILHRDGGMKPERETTLEQDLCQEFGLLHAFVFSNFQEKQTNSYKPLSDDHLHYILSKEVASFLQTIIRPGDFLLTVGGRGAFFPAKYLAIDLSIRKKIPDIQVFSISGKMATRVHEAMGDFATPSADADDAAYYFSTAFQTQPHLLHRPVADANGYRDADQDFKDIFELDGTLKNTSTLCICGVGRLGGRHTFMSGHPFLKDIQDDINIIKDLLDFKKEKIGDEYFYPAGDMANRLFLTEDIEDTQLRNKILSQMDIMNRKIVGLTFSQFAAIPLIILNTGGYHKYPAIKTVLGFQRASGKPLVNVLFIDAFNAKRLLDEKNKSKINVEFLPGEKSFRESLKNVKDIE